MKVRTDRPQDTEDEGVDRLQCLAVGMSRSQSVLTPRGTASRCQCSPLRKTIKWVRTDHVLPRHPSYGWSGSAHHWPWVLWLHCTSPTNNVMKARTDRETLRVAQSVLTVTPKGAAQDINVVLSLHKTIKMTQNWRRRNRLRGQFWLTPKRRCARYVAMRQSLLCHTTIREKCCFGFPTETVGKPKQHSSRYDLLRVREDTHSSHEAVNPLQSSKHSKQSPGVDIKIWLLSNEPSGAAWSLGMILNDHGSTRLLYGGCEMFLVRVSSRGGASAASCRGGTSLTGSNVKKLDANLSAEDENCEVGSSRLIFFEI